MRGGYGALASTPLVPYRLIAATGRYGNVTVYRDTPG